MIEPYERSLSLPMPVCQGRWATWVGAPRVAVLATVILPAPPGVS
jgi:hypothetical protein